MEYCTLNGFLVVLMIKGLSSSIQSSTEGTHHYGQTSPQEPELPLAKMVPAVVSPPSLKEVQQAVHEVSEQVEGREAEEVLKELLDRVVEAALGQVDGGSDAKVDPGTVQKAPGEEVDSQADENMGVGEDASVEEKQDEAEVDASKDISRGVVMEEDKIEAGSVKKTTEGDETGVREADSVKVIDETLGTEYYDEVVERVVAETRGDLTGMGRVQENNRDIAILSEEKSAIGTEIQEIKETPPIEVAVHREPEQQTVGESELNLGVADVEQIGHDWIKEESLEEETQVDKIEGETIVWPSDNYDIEATQTIVKEPIVEEEEVNIAKEPNGPEEEQEQGNLVEGGAGVEVELGGTNVGEAKGDDSDGESVIEEDSVVLVNKSGDQKEAEEEQVALETSIESAKVDQDVAGISGPEPDDGAGITIEQSPENQASTADLFLIDVETEEKNLSDEKFNGNEIITPTNDLFPYYPVDAQPTLDNFMNDVLAEDPRTKGEALGETNELVKDPAITTESTELGLETWKIGAVTAAVFLVLETVVIIIYIIKCRHRNNTLALQRACEEGCVEPEATTGDDYSDDTLPAGSGDPQHMSFSPLSPTGRGR
ncbi:uncharacterized protein LOC115788094 isoform X2 [Archocentrus centrarchus]|uniref:uncharacterized protein LOC115788094 isoform X2 n=1 Tax=Archocentrus centrarchus TaxID=63155 RepID=UPI0011E9FC46|nr:uncharacterized protein LOC115788094 isoform X2 [Archocentrus centrarchus]